MLEFKCVSAEDFERYNKYRALDVTNASEGVFITMFIWNNYYNMEYADNGEFLFIRFNIKNKAPAYFFPIGKGNLKNAIKELEEYSRAREERLRFMLVTKENAERLKEITDKQFSFTPARDTFDYVYLTEKMINLPGKKLHAKRNHLNYFFENYEYEYVPVTDAEFLNRCAQKALEWVGNKTRNKNSFELGAMERYFEHYFRFNQKGAALTVNGEIVAMTFGEKLSEDTALIQIELADESYRGAYQAINKLFCQNEWQQVKYVNREEDMGIEGLRRAKESYQPEFLVEKYIIEEKIKYGIFISCRRI